MNPPGPRVVGRDRELARLNGYAAAALGGRGQVAFVAGEAGAGKTTLVEGFAAGLREQHPDALVVAGRCSTAGTGGDPYLPWREVMSALLGVAGAAPEEAGRGDRWRRRLARSVDLVLEVGPDLLGAIVPGAGLVAALAVALAPKDRLLAELRRRESTPLSTAAVEPARIVEQYSNLLLELARSEPLVVVLDDLHWVDQASAGLLFHLSQRIGDAPVLLVGNYRAAEVATGGEGRDARHPLDKVLHEVERYHGDVTIDLDTGDAADRARFLDQILDMEPNRFSPRFRAEILRLTGGQALFSVEVLRTLAERGDIHPDHDGRWVERPGTDIAALPARVEGVVEERIGRVSSEQRELLDLGCVEASTGGLAFTAEVVSRVLERSRRRVVTDLSIELGRGHRLVHEEAAGDDALGRTGYRFSHAIVQRYLYEALGAARRRLDHADIAAALEHLAGDRSRELSAALAWHHEHAGQSREAAMWLIEAGDRAAAAGAPEAATDMFRRALVLLPSGTLEERWRALLGLASASRLLQAEAEALATLQELVALARSTGDPGRISEAWWRLSGYQIGRDDQEALAAATEALTAADQAGRADIEARVQADLTYLERSQGRPEAAALAARRAWTLSEGLPDDTVLYVAWRLSWHYTDEGDLGRAMELTELALTKARDGDPQMLPRVLTNLTDVYIQLGLLDRARPAADEALAATRRAGDSSGLTPALGNRAAIELVLGDPAAAEASLREAQSVGTGGNRFLAGALDVYLGMVLEARGESCGSGGGLPAGRGPARGRWAGRSRCRGLGRVGTVRRRRGRPGGGAASRGGGLDVPQRTAAAHGVLHRDGGDQLPHLRRRLRRGGTAGARPRGARLRCPLAGRARRGDLRPDLACLVPVRGPREPATAATRRRRIAAELRTSR